MQLIALSQGAISSREDHRLLTKKVLLFMRMTLILLVVGCLQVSAKGYSQLVTLLVKNVPLEKVFKELKKQTGYDFWYESNLLNKTQRVSVEVRNIPLEQALDQCFKDQPFTYNIVDKIIVVKRKPVNETLPLAPGITVMEFPLLIDIGGTVTDDNGQPLADATVLVKGTNVGTKTDANGKFTINAEPNSTLIISFVGFESTEVKVDIRTSVAIRLKALVTVADDVVVIGYGTAKKSDLTGAISQVNAKDFRNQSMTQVTDMLAGTTSGVYTIQGTSAAGGGAMQIRGVKSLSGGTDPLIVLDGVIYNGSIRDINPNDVESIDILKDASSAAVFGSKAASGVIIISTKKGRTGKPTIDFTSQVGVATTTHDLKPFGPKAYLDMHRDYFTQSSGSGVPYGYYFSPDELPDGITIEQWRNFSANPAADNIDEWIGRIRLKPIEIENYKAGKTTDFYDLVIGPALRQDYSLGVGGGSKDLKYYFSVGYLNNEGIIKGDEFSTLRTRLNLDLKVTDWLNIGANSQFTSRDQSVYPASLGLMSRQSPYGSMWNEDGTLRNRPNDYSINPLGNYYGQNRLYKINTLFSNLFATVKLPFGFRYNLSFQPSFGFSKDYSFWSSSTTTGGDSHVGGYGTRSDASSYAWLLDNLLTWNKEIGIHSFDVTLLANAEVSKSWSSYQENSNFKPNENLMYHALQFGSRPGLSNYDDYRSGNALMARLNYTLLDKYLLTASVRRDGYSAFGQENPQATFPAFAFAWKISDESFYKIPWMNQLKLRLSWGENGNRDIGAYAALAQLGSVTAYDGSSIMTGVYNATLSNYGLRWERTQSKNIGLDIGLFQNRVNLTMDVYDVITTDMLLNRKLPIITGFSSITSNLGKLGNRGLEFSINTINLQTKTFEWRSNLAFSMNRNKIKELWGDIGDYKLLGESRSGELPDFSNKWFPGQAVDVVWDYDVVGVWQLGEEPDAAVYGLVPGNYKAADVNKDGKYLQLDDKKFIGHTAPRYRLGLRNEFTVFKNLSATVFIRADLGHIRSMDFLNDNYSEQGNVNTWSFPYWSIENPTNDYARYAFPDNLGQYGGGLILYRPTGFVRVQDVTLSYNFPTNITQRVKLNSLRVFGSVRNFLTFTDWQGFDPESGMTPMPRVFTAGVNLTL